MTIDERIARVTLAILEDEAAKLRRQLRPTTAKTATSKKKMTAAARREISRRMKAHWKQFHKEQKEKT